MPKIVYDLRNCEGFFVCVKMDPGSFQEGEVDGEDKSLLIDGQEEEDGIWVKPIAEEDLDRALRAALGCPANVIQVFDDDGKVIEPPVEETDPTPY